MNINYHSGGIFNNSRSRKKKERKEKTNIEKSRVQETPVLPFQETKPFEAIRSGNSEKITPR